MDPDQRMELLPWYGIRDPIYAYFLKDIMAGKLLNVGKWPPSSDL